MSLPMNPHPSPSHAGRLAAAAAALVALSVGCGGPSADEVRARTSALLEPMITETAKALDAAAGHATLKRLLEKIDLGALWPTDDAPVAVKPVEPPPPPPMPDGSEADAMPMAPQEVPEPPPPVEEGPRQTISEQAGELAGELDDFLARYVFRDDAVESSSGGKTTFVIRGEVVCDADDTGDTTTPVEPVPKPVRGSDSAGAPAYDEALPSRQAAPEVVEEDRKQRCIDSVNRLGLRIDATLAAGGVDLDLRVGAADGALVTIVLRPGRFTVKVYLPAAAQAATDIAAVVDEQLPDGFPTLMQGVVAFTMKQIDARLVAELAVLEAIKIAGQTEGAAYSGELPAADPLLGVGYSTADGSLDAVVDWRATDILLPANAMFREELQRAFDQPLRLLLGGLQAKLKATAAGELQLEQLSVGQVNALLFGSDVLAKLELNPQADRQLSLTVAPWQQDELQCSVDPTLDVQLEVQLGRLDDYLTDPAPPAIADERYQLLLASAGGTLPAVVPLSLGGVSVDAPAEPRPLPAEPVPTDPVPTDPVPTDPVPTDPVTVPEETERPLARVLSGSLTLQSFVQPVKITVAAGQCLLDQGRAEQDEAAARQPLAGLAAGACN